MDPRFRKQVLLFAAVVLVPSLLLIAVGIGLLVQEDELQVARLREGRQVAARELSLQLLDALDSPSPAALVATLVWRGDEILLPWDLDREQSAAELRATSAAVRQALRRGEVLEFAEADYAGAAEAYADALEVADGEAPRGVARLNLARALISGGRSEDATPHVATLLATPLAVTDEYGVPLAVFALAQAERLTATPGSEMAAGLPDVLAGGPLLAPATLNAIDAYHPVSAPTGLAERGEDTDGTSAVFVEPLRVRSSRLQTLRDELRGFVATAGLAGTSSTDPPLWLAAAGEPLWLVGVPPSGDLRDVTVVEADRLLAGLPLPLRGLALTTDRSVTAPLGPRFPGVFVRFPSTFDAELTAGSRRRRLLFAGALFVIVSATGLGAWVVFRDIRREATLVGMRSRFVASVSHELKTPLTAVRMFTELLQREPLSPDRRTRYVETILNESERLSRLLDNVLDFSKIERGEKHYALRPMRLQAPLGRAEAALKQQLDRQGCLLRTTIDDSVPAVVADADAIEQAVVNLISNAVKYAGGRPEIDLSLCRNGDEAVIAVRDRGIGIAAADRERIFDEFFRAPDVDRSQVPGTGLGLTVVAHIAKAHQARIDVDSRPGEGSTFSLSFPIPPASESALVGAAP